MNIESFYEYCMAKPWTTASFPFGEDVLVFKVMNKMYALTDVEKFDGINLKCNPERAVELRAAYEEIKPGYHMNKTHWNTVVPNGKVKDDLLKELIDHSYELVISSVPAKKQEDFKKNFSPES